VTRDVFEIEGTTQASHFHVEEAVAEGGFAVVYRAQHTAFRSPVALKCLKIPRTLSPGDRETFLEKFREEAELLFRLSSVNTAVVRPLQVGTLERKDLFVPFLALEWLDGDPLDVLRDRRADAGLDPYDIRTLVKMLTPAASALADAHQLDGPEGPAAIIHCDLKPDNLFLSTRGNAESIKILDFGIARVKTASKAGTRSPSDDLLVNAAFTPQYGAPEQWRPDLHGQTGPWTDVYGLAISMVDLLAGRPALEGSIPELALAVLDAKKRPTPRSTGPKVNDGVEAAFARALAVDPRLRTPSVDVFWSELEEALGMRPTFDDDHPRSTKGDSVAPPPGWDLTVRSSRPSLSVRDSTRIKERGEWQISLSSNPGIDLDALRSTPPDARTPLPPAPNSTPPGGRSPRAASLATLPSARAPLSIASPPSARPRPSVPSRPSLPSRASLPSAPERASAPHLERTSPRSPLPARDTRAPAEASIPSRASVAPSDSRTANLVAAGALAIASVAIIAVEARIAGSDGHHAIPGGGFSIGIPLAAFAIVLVIRAFSDRRA
jgi:serine/threonine-protein kinase